MLLWLFIIRTMLLCMFHTLAFIIHLSCSLSPTPYFSVYQSTNLLLFFCPPLSPSFFPNTFTSLHLKLLQQCWKWELGNSRSYHNRCYCLRESNSNPMFKYSSHQLCSPSWRCWWPRGKLILNYQFYLVIVHYESQDIGDAERTALQIVSYIGCAISIICLTATVIFFLFQGYNAWVFNSQSFT